MEISAGLVKKLRDETDAPLMEGKRSLQQAASEGITDEAELITRAKEILREGGKLAAGKRADRTVSNGTIAVGRSGNAASAVVLLCETDFVARNEDFIALAQKLADHFAAHAPSTEPANDVVDGKTVTEYLVEAVGKIRENIQLGNVSRVDGDAVGAYLHHDKAKAALVSLAGGNGSAADLANKIGTQIVALSPEFVSRDNVDQDRLSKEIAAAKQTALDEGKPEEIAEKIAQGKVSKEFLQQVVLLEQPWYAELSKKVGDVVKETGGGATVTKFIRLEAGKPSTEAKA